MDNVDLTAGRLALVLAARGDGARCSSPASGRRAAYGYKDTAEPARCPICRTSAVPSIGAVTPAGRLDHRRARGGAGGPPGAGAQGPRAGELPRRAASPFPPGLAAVAASLIALGPAAIADHASDGDVWPSIGAPVGIVGMVLYVIGVAVLGLIDDLLGAGDERGWRGHARATAGGGFSPGLLKAAGAAGLALFVLAGSALDTGDYLLAAGGARARHQLLQPARPAAGALAQDARPARRGADARLDGPRPALGARAVRGAAARAAPVRPARARRCSGTRARTWSARSPACG